MKLTPEELASLSPDERAALQDDSAEQHLATYGDNKPGQAAASGTDEATNTDPGEGAAGEGGDDGEGSTTDATGDDAAAAAAADGAAGQDGKPAPTKEEAAAALEELEAPKPTAAPAPSLPTYNVDGTDFAAQRKELRDQKLAMHKDWSEGKLTDDEFAQRTVELDDKLTDLAVAQGRAAALKEANEQHARMQAEAEARAETQACADLALRVKGQIDYFTDNAAAQQFDVLLKAAKVDPENKSKPISSVVEKVHKAMLALRGIADTTASPPPAPAPGPKPPRDVPRTLSGVPNAAPTGVQDDAMEAAGRLDGVDLELYLARLPEDKLRKVMRNADNSFFNA